MPLLCELFTHGLTETATLKRHSCDPDLSGDAGISKRLKNMIAKGGYVYIVSNKNRTTLYIGVTSNLYNRIYEHKNGLGSVFTRRYNCTDLLYYEFYEDIESAIRKEKQMKKWKRKYKENVINAMNPKWMDIFDQIEECQ